MLRHPHQTLGACAVRKQISAHAYHASAKTSFSRVFANLQSWHTFANRYAFITLRTRVCVQLYVYKMLTQPFTACVFTKKWQRHRAFMWKCLLFRCSPFDGQLWSWIDTNNYVSSTPGAVFSCVYMLTRDLLKREVQTCWNSTVGALQLWSTLPISRVSLKVVCSHNAATQGGICFLAPHAHLISCVR